jgi:hypothetical protein
LENYRQDIIPVMTALLDYSTKIDNPGIANFAFSGLNYNPYYKLTNYKELLDKITTLRGNFLDESKFEKRQSLFNDKIQELKKFFSDKLTSNEFNNALFKLAKAFDSDTPYNMELASNEEFDLLGENKSDVIGCTIQ